MNLKKESQRNDIMTRLVIESIQDFKADNIRNDYKFHGCHMNNIFKEIGLQIKRYENCSSARRDI